MAKSKNWFDLLSLTSKYERHARIVPAVISLTPLVILSLALGGTVAEWEFIFYGSSGAGVLLAILLSTVASIFGNRFQEKLWPDWPFDNPTCRRLMPGNVDTSPQQRLRWYEQSKLLTGLDIQLEVEKGNVSDIRATINDTIVRLRNCFKQGRFSDRHEKASIQYGYARNLAGLNSIQILFGVASSAINWILFYRFEGELSWALVSTAILAFSLFLSNKLPGYVRTRAGYYSECFFQLLEESAGNANNQ